LERLIYKNVFIKKISILMLFILVSVIFINSSSTSVRAEVYDTKPSFKVNLNSITPNPAMVGQDLTVSGTIEPQPFESIVQKKQVVLVLDVSGSMAGTKITNLKTAANNFITKMSTISNMEIAIIAFSSKATINPVYGSSTTTTSKSLDSDGSHNIPNYVSSGATFLSANDSSKVSSLKQIINNLEALGGTNTGEGLRKAEYMLEKATNADANASKSIVFMSDGMPTFYSVNQSQRSSSYTPYTNIDNTSPYYAGSGSETTDNINKSKTYAVTIGNIIKKQNANIFSIGYGLGTETSTGNIAMQDIHKSMGGTTGVNGTFYATDENAIDGVFSKIADKIIEKYTLSDVQVDLSNALNFDSKFSLISGENVINVRNVNYTRQTRTDGRIIYIADKIPFSFTIKGNKQGVYDDVFNGVTVTAPWNGQTLVTYMPKVGVSITENTFPVIKADIVSQTPNPATLLQRITLNCKVKPESFQIDSTTFDTSGPKDVIFLVDTSSSMSDKLNSVKNGLFGKIVNNSEIKNAEYGIVSFNSTVKYNYISDGLTDNITTLDSAIKNISSTTDTGRNVGDAMARAKNIFSNNGRSNSSKYIILIAGDTVQYTDSQLYDIESCNYNIITVNLGYIRPPVKVDDKITPGADEPDNNIKSLHYNLIGKLDNGDNVLEKAENNYFININYSNVTNTNNPNEFFTKESNINQMNTANEVHNWILPLVAEKLKNATAQIKAPSYTFKVKLKFKTNGKFDIVSGLNTCSDTGYDYETPEFNVTYTLQNGQYVPDTVGDKSFDIKVKSGIDISNLKFGPGIVSYINLSNKSVSNPIDPFPINLESSLDILNHGIYEGIKDNQPSIIDGSNRTFNITKGTNVNLGANMNGSLNNETGISLIIPKEIEVNGVIKVFIYDDYGNLAQVGTMNQSAIDDNNKTYKYNGDEIIQKKILILYNEKIPDSPSQEQYINRLFISDGDEKDVTINVAEKSPDLF